ncbi:YcgN family cysteine cluster protein [Amorphus sp. 3PC139-8]|uniref:YcgN family cysteine cluster protein n=1 Tax=Amorphus sp. 3PC139-8 TaxID=2735676 RepID=UPI00345DBAC2
MRDPRDPLDLAALADGAAPPDAGERPRPFWEEKRLDQMTGEEWEQLCDGCARCCLNKLEDWDTGEIYWTNVACRLLDDKSCRCRDYPNRATIVPDCIPLTPKAIEELTWLPPTCGYRLISEGKPLYWWHPLVSGDPETVHQAGISARGRTISEEGLALEDYERFLVDWPGEE